MTTAQPSTALETNTKTFQESGSVEEWCGQVLALTPGRELDAVLASLSTVDWNDTLSRNFVIGVTTKIAVTIERECGRDSSISPSTVLTLFRLTIEAIDRMSELLGTPGREQFDCAICNSLPFFSRANATLELIDLAKIMAGSVYFGGSTTTPKERSKVLSGDLVLSLHALSDDPAVVARAVTLRGAGIPLQHIEALQLIYRDLDIVAVPRDVTRGLANYLEDAFILRDEHEKPVVFVFQGGLCIVEVALTRTETVQQFNERFGTRMPLPINS